MDGAAAGAAAVAGASALLAALALGACATAAPNARLAATLAHTKPEVCLAERGGKRVYRVLAPPVSRRAMGLVAEAETVAGRPAAVVSMSFVVRSPSWRYAKCSTLALGGAGRVRDVAAERDGEIIKGGVEETINWKMRVERLLELLAENELQFHLCNDSGPVPASTIKALRWMVTTARRAADLPPCKGEKK